MDIKESQILMDNWLEWKNKNNIDLLRLEDMQDMLKLNVFLNLIYIRFLNTSVKLMKDDQWHYIKQQM